MAGNDHDIVTLNALIATTFDSVDGYDEAGRHDESGRFANLFASRADERRRVAEDLQDEVTRLGGEPEEDGTLLAGAHRSFVNLKSLVTRDDTKAVIDEVERGEDHIKAKYEDALEDNELSPMVRAAIEKGYESVRAGHDEMRDLKHSLDVE